MFAPAPDLSLVRPSAPEHSTKMTLVSEFAPEFTPVLESVPEFTPVPSEVTTSIAEPPLATAGLFPELKVFPVTFVSTTGTIIKLFLLPDAFFMATSVISVLSLSIETPVATPVETPELAGVFASAPLKTGVPTCELFVFIDCPTTVKRASSELSAQPVTAKDAVF